MSSFSQKKHLDFTKEETKTKSNPDYFNLKTDRANEEKQEKGSKLSVCFSSGSFYRSICCCNLRLKHL